MVSLPIKVISMSIIVYLPLLSIILSWSTYSKVSFSKIAVPLDVFELPYIKNSIFQSSFRSV